LFFISFSFFSIHFFLFQKKKQKGNPGGTSRTSSFEITIGDSTQSAKLLWSKLGGQGFPQPEDAIAKIKASLQN